MMTMTMATTTTTTGKTATTTTVLGFRYGLRDEFACLGASRRALRRVEQPYGFIAEEGHLPGGMKRRVLRYLYLGPDGGLLRPAAG